MLENPNDKRHGTHNGYANYGCRCARCKSAHREYVAFIRRRKLRELLANPGDKRHGHLASYYAGCRCDKCKARESEYHREWRASKRSSSIKK